MKRRGLVPYTGSLVDGMNALSGLGNDIYSVFDNLWKNFDLDARSFSDLQPKTKFPKINVAETDDKYEIEIALAGFDKDDVELELKDNCLCVKADKQEEVKEEDKKYLVREISSRSFRRALQFPKKVLTDDVDCNFKDGIITCILKKEQEKEDDDTVKIQIQ
jgi:HSP20 family protein